MEEKGKGESGPVQSATEGEKRDPASSPRLFSAFSRFAARLRRHYRDLYLEAFGEFLEKGKA